MVLAIFMLALIVGAGVGILVGSVLLGMAVGTAILFLAAYRYYTQHRPD